MTEHIDGNQYPIKIILADDHPLFREGLKTLLEPGAMCYESASLQEMFALLESHPDSKLILMDLKMPGVVGFQGVQETRQRYPKIPLIIVSMHCEPKIIQSALSFGISGYIPKTHNFESMQKAIELVLGGTLYIPKEILTNNSFTFNSPQLTRRQHDIYRLIMKGCSNQEITDELCISLSTVKMHVSTVLEKIGVKNRAQLLANGRDILN